MIFESTDAENHSEYLGIKHPANTDQFLGGWINTDSVSEKLSAAGQEILTSAIVNGLYFVQISDTIQA